jgi:4-hydroxy 2-oxovalerate aldolase
MNITTKLSAANIDIIECGFLRVASENSDCTLFKTTKDIVRKSPHTTYAVMVEDGQFPSGDIPLRSDNTIDVIRFIFKPGRWRHVRSIITDTIGKGYQVCVNPVLTNHYSDRELLILIDEINNAAPYAFSVVDTFGSMHRRDLLHIFHLIDNNLDPAIAIGYHAHNTLQMAFSNAVSLTNLKSKRVIIIDCSIFGMGRGAGNLCTELIVKYLNDNFASPYNLTPILEIINDEILPIHQKTPWGYSVPYFLAATLRCHPNYATYLMSKQTLPVQAMQDLLMRIPDEQKQNYDETFISKQYLSHQSNIINDCTLLEQLRLDFQGKRILVIAPGKSANTEKEKILGFIRENKIVTVLVNFVSDIFPKEYLFIGNQRRFAVLSQNPTCDQYTVLITSNITAPKTSFPVHSIDYSSLISSATYAEFDNSGVMALRLLVKLGVEEITLAGFDGFSLSHNNYANDNMNYFTERTIIDQRNTEIAKQIHEVEQIVNVRFLTASMYK